MNFLVFEGKTAVHVYLICIIFSLCFNFLFFEWDWFAQAITSDYSGSLFSREALSVYLPVIVIIVGLCASAFFNIISHGNSSAIVVYGLIFNISLCLVAYFFCLITGSTIVTPLLKVSIIFWQTCLFVDPLLAKIWHSNAKEENKKTGSGSYHKDGSDENYDPNSSNGGTRGRLSPGHSNGR